MIVFLFKHPATTYTYTLSLHDALPIFQPSGDREADPLGDPGRAPLAARPSRRQSPHPLRGREPLLSSGQMSTDRKSTRLNSSHITISYAVFCLKKKKNHT